MDDNEDLLGDLLGGDEYDFGGAAVRDQSSSSSRKNSSNRKKSHADDGNEGNTSLAAVDGPEEITHVEEEGDSDSEDEFASDFQQLDSFLSQRGVAVKEVPLNADDEEGEQEEEPKLVSERGSSLSSTTGAAAAPAGSFHVPPAAVAGGVSSSRSNSASSNIPKGPSSIVSKSISLDSSAAIAAGPSVASSSTSNHRQGTPSPINLVTPANQYSADEASLAFADDSYEPFSPALFPNGQWEALSPGAKPKSASQSIGRSSMGKEDHLPSSTRNLPGRHFFNHKDGDYENEGYEEYDDIEWPSSPSKSAAKLWSLKKDMDQGKDLGKGQYASVKEALLSLTRHDKPKKTMNLNRVMKIAEPKKLKVQRKFGKDEEEMNCYFKPRKSAKALAAARNPACGYDFIRRLGEEDNEGDFLRRTDVAEKKRLQDLEYARGEAAYAKKQDKKSCPSCGAAQSYSEVIDKRKRCPNCLEDYRLAHIFDRKAWSKRLADAMKTSERRRAKLTQQVLTEIFGGIKNVPKGELACESSVLGAATQAAAAAVSTPAGISRGRCLKRQSSAAARAAAAVPSPERKALNEVEKLLKEAESGGESRIDLSKLKNAVAIAAAGAAGNNSVVAHLAEQSFSSISSKHQVITPAAGTSVIAPTASVSSINKHWKSRRKSSVNNQDAGSGERNEGAQKRQSVIKTATVAANNETGGGGGLSNTRRKSSSSAKGSKRKSSSSVTASAQLKESKKTPAAGVSRKQSIRSSKKKSSTYNIAQAEVEDADLLSVDAIPATADTEKIFQKLVLM